MMQLPLSENLRISGRNAADLAGQCDKHKVAGFFYACRRHELGEELFPSFRQEWQKQFLRSSLLKRELAVLAQEFAEKKIEPLLLKGASLFPLYPDPGARFFADIDLVFSEEERVVVSEIFLRNGFRECPSDHFEAGLFTVVFAKGRGENEVAFDLHFGRFYIDDKEVEWATEAAFLKPYRQLAPTDNLLHQMIHCSYQHGYARLGWLLDLDLMLRSASEIDTERFLALARGLRKERSVALTLELLQENFRSPVPEKLRVWMKNYRRFLSIMSRFIDEEYLLFPERHRIRYIFLKHFLKRGLFHALRDDVRWVFSKL